MGQILDFWYDSPSDLWGNLVYNPDSSTETLLPDYPNSGQCGSSSSCYTIATGMNNAGIIVGYWNSTVPSSQYHGFLSNGSTFKSVDYPGATGTWLQGINDAGLVAGYYEDAVPSAHGFIYNSKTAAFVLGPLDYPGAADTTLIGINGQVELIGSYHNSGNPIPYGFFWQNGNFYGTATGCGLQGLNDNGVIAGGSSNNTSAWGTISYSQGADCITVNYPGSTITDVYSINDVGQLSGTYYCSGYYCVFYAVPQ